MSNSQRIHCLPEDVDGEALSLAEGALNVEPVGVVFELEAGCGVTDRGGGGSGVLGV